MSALTVVSSPLPAVSDLTPESLDYGRAALAPNTMRAYKADWAEFQDWCAARGRSSPAVLAGHCGELRQHPRRCQQARVNDIEEAGSNPLLSSRRRP